MVANPFAVEAADRYDLGRPYHHERTLARGPDLEPGSLVLDVAGGTGLSTQALVALGARAVCIDVSAPMLRVAAAKGLSCVFGAAEHLPVPDGRAAALTVSSAVHWFDQDAFYREARRVLAPGGHLVLYEHYFAGSHAEQPDFGPWFAEEYLALCPLPPRNRMVGSATPEEHGFVLEGDDEFEDPIDLTLDELVAYLLSQSTSVAKVESGEMSVDELRAWLREGCGRFYDEPDRAASIGFWGRIQWFTPATAGS